MASINGTVDVRDVVDMIGEVRDKLTSSSIHTALTEAAKIYYAGFEQRVPVGDSGRLRSSISISSSSQTSIDISVGSDDIPYTLIQNYGGTIVPTASNKTGYLHFKIDNQWVMVRSVTIKPIGFYENTFDQDSDKAEEAFYSSLDI